MTTFHTPQNIIPHITNNTQPENKQNKANNLHWIQEQLNFLTLIYFTLKSNSKEIKENDYDNTTTVRMLTTLQNQNGRKSRGHFH